MPGAVPVTSTAALTNATIPYVVDLASAGVVGAITEHPGLKLGVNVAGGQVTYAPVAEAVGAPCVAVDDALGVAAAGVRTAGRRTDAAAPAAERGNPDPGLAFPREAGWRAAGARGNASAGVAGERAATGSTQAQISAPATLPIACRLPAN